MSDKSSVDLKTFVENLNKQNDMRNKKHNGKKVRFGWTKRKRK
jgi:hypothetical protein